MKLTAVATCFQLISFKYCDWKTKGFLVCYRFASDLSIVRTARDIPTSAQRWKKRPSFMHHSCTVRHHLVAFHTNCWTNESNERPAAAEEEEVPKSIEKRHDRSVCPRRPRHVEPLLRAITDRNVAHTHIHIYIYTHIHTYPLPNPADSHSMTYSVLWHMSGIVPDNDGPNGWYCA